MGHRICAAAIVVKCNALLLVSHKNRVSGTEVWIPPGGGLEDGESVYDCARREALEETGLKVTLGKILYLREYTDREKNRHSFEVFILTGSFEGEVSIVNAESSDPNWNIGEAKFFSSGEMKERVLERPLGRTS